MAHLLERLAAVLADRYHVDREIGRGGMAHVFLAHDLKLDRPVALKVLRPDLAAVLGGDRFLREITLAAKLEHPHILGIYDSGEADGILYYVMPYVEGESLRGRLDREKQLPLDDALQITREVTDALSYAHSHGVIHRDVKPENILLEAGHAVVADFGIARAIDAAGGERLTETGVTLGTPAYMSPEQAGGSRELDGRSDLYSLGCVLYEMLAGEPPFTGVTIESVVAQHLSAPPPDVTTIRPAVPSWVAAALQRALAKTPADRFNPVTQFGEAISPRSSVTVADARAVPATAARRRRLGPRIGTAAVMIVIAVLLGRMMGGRPISITTSHILPVTSDPGLEFQPALSPDGEEVAYVEGPIGNSRIVVRSAIEGVSGGETRLGDEWDGPQWLPAWTPDGASLRFYACRSGRQASFGADCDWKLAGKHGGPLRSVSAPRRSALAWSEDGRRAVFAHRDSIFAAAADTGKPELLGLSPSGPWVHSFAWSPDGQLIAFVNGNMAWRLSANVLASSIWILSANGGEPVRVTDLEHMDQSPQWLPDSRHLLFVSDRDGARGIYAVEVGSDGAHGPPRAVPGASDPHSISVSTDGRRLAYSKFRVVANIWSLPIPRSGAVSIRDAVAVTTGNQVIETHGLSPDGAWIAFSSNVAGESDIYRMPLPGSDRRLVAEFAGDAFSPDWSPEGSEIAFYGGTSSAAHVFVVPAEGGTAQRVENGPGGGGNPAWSPDGLTIAFDTPSGRAWKVSREGVGLPWGNPVQLGDSTCWAPRWYRDGASVLCHAGPTRWTRVSRDGKFLSHHYASAFGLWEMSAPRFSPDGSRIYFQGTERNGTRGLWWTLASGGEATKIVSFDGPSAEVQGFGVTVGPEHFYFTLVEYESDIYVMDLEW